MYEVTCRQLAYDNDMLDIVELIDELSGNYWRHRKPRQRQIRLKKTWLEKHPPGSDSEDLDDEYIAGAEGIYYTVTVK